MKQPDTLNCASSALVIYSSCANQTRGHKRIAMHIRDAAVCAGFGHVTPIALSNASDLMNYASALYAEERFSRILVVRDFPDTPLSEESDAVLNLLREHRQCPALTVYIAMKATEHYHNLFREYGYTPYPYDAVISVEPGACRSVVERSGENARCRDADVKIAPLVQQLPTLSEHEIELWHELVRHAGAGDETVLWMKSGTPQEEEMIAGWMRSSLSGKLITSTQIEQAARQRGLPSTAVVRYCLLANRVVASAGYSTFWELYALGAYTKVVRWVQLSRPVEDVPGRLRLLTKPGLLENSTTSNLVRDPQCGVRALSTILVGLTELNLT